MMTIVTDRNRRIQHGQSVSRSAPRRAAVRVCVTRRGFLLMVIYSVAIRYVLLAAWRVLAVPLWLTCGV